MCRACASRRCRRYLPRTLSHRYPTACMSSGGPSILRGREARVLRRWVQLGRSRLALGACIWCRGFGSLLGGTQVAPDEAEHLRQARGPCRPLAGEPGDYPVTHGLGSRPQDFEPHGADRLEGPDVAYPGRAPAFLVGVEGLLPLGAEGTRTSPPRALS